MIKCQSIGERGIDFFVNDGIIKRKEEGTMLETVVYWHFGLGATLAALYLTTDPILNKNEEWTDRLAIAGGITLFGGVITGLGLASSILFCAAVILSGAGWALKSASFLIWRELRTLPPIKMMRERIERVTYWDQEKKRSSTGLRAIGDHLLDRLLVAIYFPFFIAALGVLKILDLRDWAEGRLNRCT